ncbi:MAG: hypothetical protein Q7T54_03430 [Candidatus Levybacteria bacterium]|nr:hypothetical protein [Candidatus Levybacteria bacterium]
MNLAARLDKLEMKVGRIVPDDNKINYVILFTRDEAGIERYRIKKDDNWVWVAKKELEKHISKYGNGEGTIVFIPEKLKIRD